MPNEMLFSTNLRNRPCFRVIVEIRIATDGNYALGNERFKAELSRMPWWCWGWRVSCLLKPNCRYRLFRQGYFCPH